MSETKNTNTNEDGVNSLEPSINKEALLIGDKVEFTVGGDEVITSSDPILWKPIGEPFDKVQVCDDRRDRKNVQFELGSKPGPVEIWSYDGWMKIGYRDSGSGGIVVLPGKTVEVELRDKGSLRRPGSIRVVARLGSFVSRESFELLHPTDGSPNDVAKQNSIREKLIQAAQNGEF